MTTNNCINNNLNNSIFYKELDLTAADFKGMFASPILFLPAPGANNFYNIFEFGVEMFYGGTDYTGGGNVYIGTGGINLSATIAGSTFITNTSTNNATTSVVGASINYTLSSFINQAAYITNFTAAFATGNSPLRAYCWYSIENQNNPESVTNNAVNNINGNQYRKKVTIIPSADMLNLGSTPYELIPAPGANKVIGLHQVDFISLYNSAAYNSVSLILNYAGDTSFTITSTTTFIMTNTASTRFPRNPLMTNLALTLCENKGITVRASGAVTSGNSPFKIVCYYSIIDV